MLRTFHWQHFKSLQVGAKPFRRFEHEISLKLTISTKTVYNTKNFGLLESVKVLVGTKIAEKLRSADRGS